MRISARRITQAASLALFSLLFIAAGSGVISAIPADFFLRLDPLAGITASVCARELLLEHFPSLLVLISALLAGRLFCGWLCPMGAVLDASGTLLRHFVARRKKTSLKDALPRHTKYLLLAAVAAAAACSVNLAFWVAPLPLLTRLFTLVLHPLGLEGAHLIVNTASPLLQWLRLEDITYWQPETRLFQTAWLTGTFWLVLAMLEMVQPRFWCRCLCPAGALMALLSKKALRRRHVSSACTACGRCSQACPMGILHDPMQSVSSECLACGCCAQACRTHSVSFSFLKRQSAAAPEYDPSRRMLCRAIASGVALAGLHKADAHINPKLVPIRPPGSLPETAFLKLCLRCSECMKACPSGGLQPADLGFGFSSLLTPFLDPRKGACRPDCSACGAVCPTHAIQLLSLAEKRWAKIGTAVIDKKTCLAWAENRRCMVCNENCPWGAIDSIVQPGHSVPVPQVKPERCYGCGYCEKHCPKDITAIHVESFGALRLTVHSFEEAAKAKGFCLGEVPVASSTAAPAISDAPPPGFLE
ncbi:MAG: 4Fe-4S dicluster domain-containing protein [Desulfovibrio sp.]|nr:4Fe-4S dicluster domain-containing protein [Desulfovibrio sp.]